MWMKYKAQTWILPLRWSESAVYSVLPCSLFVTHADLFAPSALHRFQVHWDLFVILLSFSSESLMQNTSTRKHGWRSLYRDSSRVLQQRARDSDSWPTFILPDLFPLKYMNDLIVLYYYPFSFKHDFCSSMHDIFPTEYDSLSQRYRPFPLRNDGTVTTPISLPLITVHFSPGACFSKVTNFSRSKASLLLQWGVAICLWEEESEQLGF